MKNILLSIIVMSAMVLCVNAEEILQLPYKNIKEEGKLKIDNGIWTNKIPKKEQDYFIKFISDGSGNYSEFYNSDGAFAFTTDCQYEFLYKGRLIGYSNQDLKFYEFIKQILAVLGSRRAFRVILNAEHSAVVRPHSLNGFVKQIYVGYFKPGSGKTAFSDSVGVILRGYLNLSGQQIFNRMISSSVTEFELVGFGAAGKAYQLMTETYSENGKHSFKFPDKRYNRLDVLWVARSV